MDVGDQSLDSDDDSPGGVHYYDESAKKRKSDWPPVKEGKTFRFGAKSELWEQGQS